MHAWPAPDVPDLPGSGLPLRLHDTATGQVRPTAPGPDGADVRLRHHALRRDPHRARRDLRRRSTWCTGSGATPATTCTTCRTSPTSTTRCSSARCATARTGRRWPSARPTLFREDMTSLGGAPAARVRRRGRGDPRRRRRGPPAARAGRGVRRRGRHLLLGAQRPAVRRRRQPGRRRPCSRCSPSAAATRSGRARSTRWTACSGRRPGRGSRRGRPATPSCPTGRPGWHVECAAIALQSPRRRLRRAGRRQRPGVPAPRDERLGGPGPHRHAGRSPGTTCTPGWSGSTARRCRSRAATWCSSRRCAATGATRWRVRLALLAHHYRGDWSWTGRRPHRRPRPGWPGGARRWRGRPGRRPTRCWTASAGTWPTTWTRPAPWPWSTAGRRRPSPAAARTPRPALVARTVDALLGVRL